MMTLCLLFFQKIGGLVEFILNGILEENIQIQDLFIQKEFINPDENKKSIIMDIYAIDTNGNSYCLEVQNDLRNAPPQRLRFYCSMSDFPLLDKGSKDFKELKSNTIIFLCAKDKYKEGKAMYPFIYKGEVSNHPFNDGSRLIYVNGEYKGNHPIADIVHDMKCSNPEDCRLSIFKNTLKYYKTERGEKGMCEKVQKFVEERVLEMKDEIRNEVKAEVRNEVKAEVRNEVKAEVRNEVKAEVRNEVKAEVRNEVTQEVTQQLKNQEEQNRLIGLKGNILSLMANLKINMNNAMELMNLDNKDRIKIMQIK